MTEPTACCAARWPARATRAACSSTAAYCGGPDLLVGLDGLRVLEVVAAEEACAGAGWSRHRGRWGARAAGSWFSATAGARPS